MRTATKFFLFSALFSLSVAGVYWFLSYERAGSVLLASMFLAPLLVASYLFAVAWRLRPPEDQTDADHARAAGVSLGRFHAESLWPFVFALGSAVALLSLVYGRWLALLGLLVTVVAVMGLMRESNG